MSGEARTAPDALCDQFIVGTAVRVTLYQVVSRRRRLRRIEEQLEIVAEEVT